MKLKNRTITLIAAAVTLSFFTLTAAFAAPEPFAKETRALVKRFGSPGCALNAEWNSETGTPMRITGCLTPPSAHTPVWIAYGFLRHARDIYKLDHPNRDLQIQEIVRHKDGSTMVTLEHVLFNTPVYGEGLVISIDSRGVIRSIEGVVRPGLAHALFHRRTHPTVKAARAAAIAGKSLPDGEIGRLSAVTKLYYLASRPSIPLVYEVAFYDDDGEEHSPKYRKLVHAVMGHIIPETEEERSQ